MVQSSCLAVCYEYLANSIQTAPGHDSFPALRVEQSTQVKAQRRLVHHH